MLMLITLFGLVLGSPQTIGKDWKQWQMSPAFIDAKTASYKIWP